MYLSVINELCFNKQVIDISKQNNKNYYFNFAPENLCKEKFLIMLNLIFFVETIKMSCYEFKDAELQ